MPEYLLRVEGVNFANVIDDTDDLSTRRGGGLLILNAAAQLLETVEPAVRTRLHAIANGASIGLFTFEAINKDDANAVRAKVEEHFRMQSLEVPTDNLARTEHIDLSHATFVVDVVPVNDNPAKAEQEAVAANRWRQLQAPSLSLKGLWEEAVEPCTLDCVRPGTANVTRGSGTDKETVPASRSVAARREYGRQARQNFYKRELGEPLGVDFVDDLETLAKGTGLDPSDAPTGTHDKIAVFYVDGNEFGHRGREILKKDGFEGFARWSNGVRQHHRTLLEDLLHRAKSKSDPSWRIKVDSEDRLRLETLLWGGDEIIWVVPAWKGWELAEWFFGQNHEVEIGEKRERVAYACGLVFCHRNAPIKNVSILAHRLVELAKGARGSQTHSLAYEILESIDDVSGELDFHRKRWLPESTPHHILVLDPTLGAKFWESLRQIAASADFPKRQLYKFAKAWRNGDHTELHLKRLEDCDAKNAFEDFRSSVGSEVACLHLLQMLPYMPTARREGAR